MNKKAIALIGLICIVWSCNPTSKLVKQGDAKRNDGLHDEASTFYYNALLQKPNNTDAKQGLSISAQTVLNEKFTTFNKLVVENNVDEAMKVYKNAEKYSQVSVSVGVPLQWPSEYDEVYIDIRAEYISKLYDAALMDMNEKRYERAEQIFERIAVLDSTYKGITVLRINTILEPLFQHGLLELQQGKFKQAFQTFSKIVQQDEGFKNAKLLKEEANQKATTTIGVLPVYITNPSQNYAGQQLSSLLSNRLSQKAAAYVKIAAFEQLHNQLDNRGLQNIVTKEQAIIAGKMLALKYVLWLNIKDIQYTAIQPTIIQNQAYEAFTENILNPYTGTYSSITKFRKVNYDDSYEQRKIELKVAYQFISVDDGKVVLSEEKLFTQQDEVHQFIYLGKITNLYQDLPTGNQLPAIDQAWRDLFTNIRRKPLTQEQLSNEAYQQLSRQISLSLLGYFK